jgi:hypothetical protein
MIAAKICHVLVRRPQGARPSSQNGNPFSATLHVDHVEVVPLQRPNQFVLLAAQNA